MDRPKECSICLEASMLHCVLNKTHLLLTEVGKATVIRVLTAEVSNPKRYKTKSGQEQRPE